MDHFGWSWVVEYKIIFKNPANIRTRLVLNVDNSGPLCG